MLHVLPGSLQLPSMNALLLLHHHQHECEFSVFLFFFSFCVKAATEEYVLLLHREKQKGIIYEMKKKKQKRGISRI